MLAMPGHTSFSTGASAHNNNHCMSTYFILMIQCRVCAIQLHVSILTSRKLSVCVGGGGGGGGGGCKHWLPLCYSWKFIHKGSKRSLYPLCNHTDSRKDKIFTNERRCKNYLLVISAVYSTLLWLLNHA